VHLVRHDGYPYYEDDWDEAATGFDGLFAIANRYLARVNARLGLPPEWLANLREEPAGGLLPGALRWLRDRPDPRHSYWIERQAGLGHSSPPPTVVDRTAVLLAGLCVQVPPLPVPSWFPLYGGQGLRILVHAGPSRSGGATVRITGVRSTLPAPNFARIGPEVFKDLDARIAEAFGLPTGVTVVDRGVRVPDSPSTKEQSPIYFAKTVPPPFDHEAEERGRSRYEYTYDTTSYLLIMRENPKWPTRLEPLLRQPLIASADADVFVQDPVSRKGARDFVRLRPSRSWKVLDAERVNVPLGNLPPGKNPALVKLVDPNFEVTNCRLVDPPLAETDPKEVPPSVHDHVRTNTFAAVNAFVHTRELFARMQKYGLPPAGYFRFVKPPIDVRYRAGILPGYKDGRTVNAQVRWTLHPDPTHPAIPAGEIEVRFALGDLESAVGRLPANLPSAAERSPLGLASDPRWCWHEYCHVLLAAAVGDLELRFAHSAGDALAAIVSDPDSALAYDQSGALRNDGPWRGVTFPWVFIPRRHDRRVQDGWGWTGRLNQPEVSFPVPGLSDKRGYWTEQILSSALFRLYRAIGGDAEMVDGRGQRKAAKTERGQAADYVVYLIMRAIQSLGAAAVTPSTLPVDFVDALKKADTATATTPGPGGYVGGTVHKVVQWAFERQGLYGMPVAGSSVIGPEDPATVDLHIEDLRATPDGPYSPVDLLGHAWHAHPGSLSVSKLLPWGWTRQVRVKVQNRGAVAATGTCVEVWWAALGNGPIPAFPDSTRWTSLGCKTTTVPRRAGGVPGSRKLSFTWNPPAGQNRYAILAAATCESDRSNIDLTTLHPCATLASPVNILVGCDNNLGLITTTIP
jgi:hypothetical protein